MSYEIKKVYLVHRGTSGPGRGGFSPPVWVWDRETAEKFTVTNGRRHQEPSEQEWEVIVIDGDVLLAQRTPEGTNQITKIEVVENTEESLRAATLRRFTEHQKKVLGLPYDDELMAEQIPSKFAWGSFDHDRMISRAYDLSDYEAEILGLSEEHTTAHREFQEIMKRHPEKHDV